MRSALAGCPSPTPGMSNAGRRSIRTTSTPRWAKAVAAVSPPTPPPTTRTRRTLLIACRLASLLLQHQRPFLADRRREFFRELGEQPWQGHLQAHMIVSNVDQAAGALTDRAHAEGKPVAGPGLVLNSEQRGIVCARGGEPGFDAAHRLLTPKAMRDRHD